MNERTYRGVVATVSPLAITLPFLSGSVLFEPCEQVGSAALSIGDEVLAIRTDGREGDADLWWVVPTEIGAGPAGPQGPAGDVGPTGATGATGQGLFVGQIVPHALAAAPALWLPCDGTTRVRASYADLFVAIGTQYNTGGEAGTDFRLPNLKGRVPVGLDTGQPEFDVRGEAGGAKTHPLAASEMPSHYHSGPSHNHTGATNNDGGGGATGGPSGFAGYASASYYGGGGAPAVIYGPGDVNLTAHMYHTHTIPNHAHNFTTGYSGTGNTGSAGGSGAHNNLQPYLTLNYAIYAGA